MAAMARFLVLGWVLHLAECSGAPSPAASPAAGASDAPPAIEKRKYVVAGLAVGDEAHFMEYWKPTFEDYLNREVASKFDDGWTRPSFKLVMATLETIGDQVRNKKVDFVFSEPLGAFACLELSHGLQALSTLTKRTAQGLVIDGISGAIIVRADSDIKVIGDLQNRIIAASSTVALAAGQAQALVMKQAGLSFAQSPKQIQFLGANQEAIVRAVANRSVDVGFVQSDLLVNMESEGKVLQRDFRCINASLTEVFLGVPFPFPVTGHVFPMWPFSAIASLDSNLKTMVAQALIRMSPSDPAAQAGHYEKWEMPLSYASLRTVQEELEMVVSDMAAGESACKSFNDVHSHLACPQGTFKLPRDVTEVSCKNRGLACLPGATCYCKPCMSGSQVELFPLPPEDVAVIDLDLNSSLTCEKMSMCGRVEQKKTAVFTVVDYLGRPNIAVTYRIRLGDAGYQEGVCEKREDVGKGFCSFNCTSHVLGTHILEVWVDGVQIDSSPMVFEIRSRDCGAQSKRIADQAGDCKCIDSTLELGGECKETSEVIPAIVVPIIGALAILGALYTILPKLGFDRNDLFSGLIWPFKVILMVVYMAVCAVFVVLGLARTGGDTGEAAAVNVRKKRKKPIEEGAAPGDRRSSLISGLNKALGLSADGTPLPAAASPHKGFDAPTPSEARAHPGKNEDTV